MFFRGKDEIKDLVSSCVQSYQAGDKNALDSIYEELSQFCRKVISKTRGKYINPDDEEAGMISNVILDAVDKYDVDRGPFMVYLGQAVRNRTVDELRKEKRSPAVTVSYDNLSPGFEENYFEDIIDDIARKQEIQEFERLLAGFALNFGDLVNISPRHTKTREQALRAAWLIAQDSELSSYLINKGTLPQKHLEEKFNLNRSLLERYRKYIIAVVLIHIYDFGYLKPYVLPAHRRDNNGSN
ncbi:MAG: hypothetical protein VB084_07005 [Syntrophomonadaceae bacterium]|nr:hypothetical protein [Syntrophomonadaceae bacterium]